MHKQRIQTNKKGGVPIVIALAVIAAMIALFLFFSGYFDKKQDTDTILVDTDNTEIVVEKKDLEEIESRLDELDIDLDDILSELEF